MAHIGSLGASPRADDAIVFDYFGEDITVTETFNDIDYLEYLEAPDEDEKASNLSFLRDVSRMLFDEENYEKFWAGRRRGRQSISDVFDTLTKLIEQASARPTGQPSDSSDGQPGTEPKSGGVSSSVLERLAGRPDLQLVVVKRHEALSA
jgi:hypothetical protein